jgi:hypothetical protein
MPQLELPRALEDYFAFAETEPTRNGRRFSITLPYLDGERMDRLQWWYHVSPAQEQMYEGTGLVFHRNLAIERFRRHIERWLEITATSPFHAWACDRNRSNKRRPSSSPPSIKSRTAERRRYRESPSRPLAQAE